MKNFIVEQAKKEIKNAIREYKTRIVENDYVESELDTNELFVAISNEDNEEIKNLLNSGVDPNIVDSETGYTPLHLAYALDDDIVQLLLNKGADVNAKSKSGRTPLQSVCFHRDFNKIKMFLDKGAKINERDNSQNTCAMYFVWASDDIYEDETTDDELQKMLDLLVQHKIDLNVRNTNNHSPLLYCYKFDDYPLMEMLVDAGADPDKEGPEIRDHIKSILQIN